MSSSCDAGYSATGTWTRPKAMAPFQMERGMGILKCATAAQGACLRQTPRPPPVTLRAELSPCA